jgi:MFS family permease
MVDSKQSRQWRADRSRLAFTPPSADQFLLAEYPDEQQRAHVIKWLGWIACEEGAHESVHWWAIPGRVPGQVRTIRVLAIFVLVAVMTGAVAAIAPRALVVPTLVSVVALRRIPAPRRGKRSGPAPLPQRPPQAINPRRPSRREVHGLLLSAIVVVALLPALVRQWRTPAAGKPGATPARTYRADRLTCLITGLAWVPLGVLFGWFSGAALSAPWDRLALVYGLAIWVFAAMLTGSYPLLKTAEFVLMLGWGERIRFLPLLEDAADRGVLRRDGASYGFRDDDTRIRLAVSGLEFAAEHRREQDRRSARALVRSRLASLDKNVKGMTVITDFAIGTAVFGAAGAAIGLAPEHSWWLILILSVLAGAAGLILGVIAAVVALAVADAYARWTLANITPSLRTRLVAVAVIALAAALLIAEAGTVLAGIVAFVLPAACVAACGAWACVLTARMVRRESALWRRLLKPVPHAAAIATTAASLLVLADRDLLTGQPAAGLLFPIAAWGSIVIWRAMGRSKRLMVKVGADIALSLALGAVLVLFFVWLANILDLPLHNVATLRDWLDSVGKSVDFPWWTWAGLYAVFIASDLAFLRWPGRLKETSEWFDRLRLVKVADTSERVLTGLHIGLLTIVLVGLTVPAAVVPTLQHQLKTAYTVALQRDLEAEGELAAYAGIRKDFSQQQTHFIALADIVTEIHDDDTPPPEDHDATSAEDHLAYSLGELQMQALALKSASLAAEIESAAQRQGFGEPVSGVSGLDDQAGKVQEQENQENQVSDRVDQTAELAAKLVASTISIPRISDNEVYEIVREYLSGLIEGSRLKDIFAAWTEHVPHAKRPPDARDTVVPDPAKLANAANDALNSAEDATGGIADPASESDDPVKAAVDMLSQAQSMEQNGGSCTGCLPPVNQENPGDEHDQPPEDHPVEP